MMEINLRNGLAQIRVVISSAADASSSSDEKGTKLKCTSLVPLETENIHY